MSCRVALMPHNSALGQAPANFASVAEYKKRAFQKTKQLSAFFLPIVHYKEDLLKMVITFPLISSVVIGPKR